jgi:hypothetical protein
MPWQETFTLLPMFPVAHTQTAPHRNPASAAST